MTERTQGRWAILAATLWIGLILGFAVFGYLYPRPHTVYGIYARASHAWWAGEDMYVTKGTDFYRYSPLFAIALSPIAKLSDGFGNALWRMVNGAVFAAGLLVWARRCLPGERSTGQMAALFLLVLPTSLHSMYIAQANLFMLGACLLGLAAAADERWLSAASWLAAATLIKGYPLALVLLLIVLLPRQLTLRFCLALASGLALPFLAGPPTAVVAQYSSWFAHLRDSAAIMRERLRSIDHLFALYGEPLEPRSFLYMQIAAGAVVLGLCMIYAWREPDLRRRLTMTFFLFTAWAMLFGPATETCTYVIVAPPIAWTLIEAFSQPGRRATRVLLIASLLLMGPLPTDLFGSTVRNFANEHGSQPIGACLLALHLIRVALTRPARATVEVQSSYPLAA
jgi:hypothetical protein